MPNPAFIPLVGSGFDSLANQRAGLMAYNRAAEEGNINRAEAADRASDNYLAQLAQLQRQDQAKQDALMQAAQERALQQQQISQSAIERAGQSAEQKREFDVSSGLEAARTKAMYDSRINERQRQLDQIAQSADFLAPQIADAGKTTKAALTAMQDAQTDLDSAAARQYAKVDPNKLMYSRQLGMFVPNPAFLKTGQKLTPEDLQAKDDANQELAAELAAYQTAKEKATSAQQILNSYLSDAKSATLLVGRNGKGQWILSSPAHGGKQWVAGEEVKTDDDDKGLPPAGGASGSWDDDNPSGITAVIPKPVPAPITAGVTEAPLSPSVQTQARPPAINAYQSAANQTPVTTTPPAVTTAQPTPIQPSPPIIAGDNSGYWSIPTTMNGQPIEPSTASKMWSLGTLKAVGPFKSYQEAIAQKSNPAPSPVISAAPITASAPKPQLPLTDKEQWVMERDYDVQLKKLPDSGLIPFASRVGINWKYDSKWHKYFNPNTGSTATPDEFRDMIKFAGIRRQIPMPDVP
jgi:hypothetical protein